MGNAGDIKAGRAYVELYADKSKWAQAFNSVKADLTQLGRNLASVGARVAAAGAAIVGPIIAASKRFADFGDQIHKMSARTGIGAQALSELKFAAEQSGATLESVETAARRMQRTIVDAADGSTSAVEALDRLGLSAGQLAGLAPEDQFTAIADRLAAIPDPTTRAAAAMELFGKSGTQLLPMLAGGAAGIEKLRAEARELGLTIDQHGAEKAAAYSDAMNRMKRAGEAAWMAIGAAVAPVLTDLADRIAAYAGTVRQWIADHKDVVVVALKVGAVLAGLGTVLATTGAGLILAGQAAGAAAAGVKALSVATALLVANPAVAAVAALTLGAIALGVAVDRVGIHTAILSSKQQELADAADRARSAELDRIDRLARLGEAERLGATQITEARGLIGQLEAVYGSLGLRVDETTGKLIGFADAQAAVNERMREAAEAQIRSQIIEKEGNQDQRRQEMESIGGGLMGKFRGAPNYYGGRLDTLQREGKAEQAEINALYKRLGALHDGGREALTGGAGGLPGLADQAAAAQEAIDDAAAKSREESLRRAEEQMKRELARLQIEVTTTDELERQLKLLDLERKYALEEEGANANLINRLFDQKKALAAGSYAAAAAAGPLSVAGASAAGTFSAEAARFLAGGTAADKIAKNTEATAAAAKNTEKHTASLARRALLGGGFVWFN
jgi:hypothetical protein